ncbi:hypothetical protein ABK040_010177 [Willaertia magna]
MSFHKLSKPFEPNFTFNKPFDSEIKLIKTGPYHIILVTSNNEIYSYGHNQPNSCHLGFEEHINYLNKFQKVNLNIGEIKLLECSPYFTVFVNKENEVWVFGKEWFKKNSNNQKQQQFIGKLKNINFQVNEVKTNLNNIYFITKSTNEIYCCTLDYNKNNKNKKKSTTNYTIELLSLNNYSSSGNIIVKEIQCGEKFCLILDKNGKLYGHGKNEFGQLGLGNKTANNEYLQLTEIPLPFKVKRIACLSDSTLILNENNELFGAGSNLNGELGIGELLSESLQFTKIPLDDNIKIVTDIYSSFVGFFTIRTVDNVLYVSGANENNCLQLDTNLLQNNIFDDEFFYVTKFTKLIELENDLDFVKILFFDNTILFLKSNYFIDNGLSNLLNEKVINCYKTLQNQQLVDLSFLF